MTRNKKPVCSGSLSGIAINVHPLSDWLLLKVKRIANRSRRKKNKERVNEQKIKIKIKERHLFKESTTINVTTFRSYTRYYSSSNNIECLQ